MIQEVDGDDNGHIDSDKVLENLEEAFSLNQDQFSGFRRQSQRRKSHAEITGRGPLHQAATNPLLHWRRLPLDGATPVNKTTNARAATT
ncbi:hypothetical protein RHGRI_004808 [Rhododendron griersonianum]|uniref:EF-hand domain-containing protein n=1 Tax=Rhododendron griersonianum TaxID=479676 RepID=A0AAV6LAS2_9ERIC|nr:hypothetical protein RHGRI_004808 [Rhododendron griersonianum]